MKKHNIKGLAGDFMRICHNTAGTMIDVYDLNEKSESRIAIEKEG